jgi:hypothetical protein
MPRPHPRRGGVYECLSRARGSQATAIWIAVVLLIVVIAALWP